MRGSFVRLLTLAIAISGVSACSIRTPDIVNSVDLSAQDFSRVESMRSGTVCRGLLFSAIPIKGSSSLVDAIKESRVRHVMLVEHTFTSYVVYAKQCTTVYGHADMAPTADPTAPPVAPAAAPAPAPAPAPAGG